MNKQQAIEAYIRWVLDEERRKRREGKPIKLYMLTDSIRKLMGEKENV